MNLGGYIHELLFRYDCVIVPGFGGFIGNYAPARIHPVQHRLYPPSKRITFNKHLQNNDGLLANLIAQREGCSFEAAMQSIEKAVSDYKKELKEKNRFVLDKIGIFHYDDHKHLHFEPNLSSNYLLDSYGLVTFQVLPARHVASSSDAVLIEKEVPVIPLNRSKVLRQSVRIAAAASLFFAMSWVALNTGLLHKVRIDRSSLNPFEREAAVYHKQDGTIKTLTKEQLPSTASDKSLADVQSGNWSFLEPSELSKDIPASIYVEEEKIARMAPASAADSFSKKGFHIVGGCFEIHENAEKLVRQLRQKGYDAHLVGKRKGLHVVSYGSFKQKQQALLLLRKVKQNHNAQAWLLKN